MTAIEPRDRRESLFTIALAALHADDRERPAERRVLTEMLTHVQPVCELDEDRARRLSDAASTGAHRLEDRLPRALDHLASRDGPQAYALALDVVLADREVDDAERRLLDRLTEALEIDPEERSRIEELLETKHGTPLEPIDLPRAREGLVELDLSQGQALLAFALAAALVDPASSPVTLPPFNALRELEVQEQVELLDAAARGLERWGREPFLEACADALEGEQPRQAFILAAQTAYADRRLTDDESAFLDEVRSLLGLSTPLSKRILEQVEHMHQP